MKKILLCMTLLVGVCAFADFEDDLEDGAVDKVNAALANNPKLLENYNKHKIPILFKAIEKKKIELVDVLVKHGVGLDIPDRYGQLSLCEAIYQENLKLVKLLVEAGASLDLAEKSGTTPLIKAIRANNMELVTFLVDSGSDPNKNAPIVSAAADPKRLDILKLLLSLKDENGARKVKIDQRSNGYTALHIALEKERTETIALYLLEQGADYKLLDTRKGYYPVHYAAKEHHLKALEWMLKKGADPNVVSVRTKVNEDSKTWTSMSPLYSALGKDDKAGETINLLLKYGAKADVETVKRAYVWWKQLMPQIEKMRGSLNAKELEQVDTHVKEWHTEALVPLSKK